MTRFPSLVLLVLFTTGCTVRHYTVTDNSRVSVYLQAPRASEVLFASSADNFQQHSAIRESNDIWAIRDMANREFRYFYIVDGTMYIPQCRFKEKDDFGAVNCIHQPQ